MSADTEITEPDGPAAAAPIQGTSRLLPSRRGRWLSFWGPPFLVLLAFLGLWYAISYLLLSPERRFLLPPPHAVLQVGFLDPYNLRELLQGLWLSARVAMVGLSIAIVIGVALAIAMSQARWVERSLYPYAVILQTIPILALVPLFGFWFGFGLTSRVLVCVLIALFPIIANTLFGLRSVEQDHHDLFTLHDAGRLVSAGLAVIGAIVGDFFFKQGEPGIGILIDLYRSRLQSEQMFAAIILSSLFGVLVFWFFGFLARRVVGSWHESARDPTAS
jgi:NitT/TauT family transport system permease protein